MRMTRTEKSERLARLLAKEVRPGNGARIAAIIDAFKQTGTEADGAECPRDWLAALQVFGIYAILRKDYPAAALLVSEIIEIVVRNFSPGNRGAAVDYLVRVLEEERTNPTNL